MPDLPALIDRYVDRWALRRDGDAQAGTATRVLPVRTDEGVPAVLKVHEPDHAVSHEGDSDHEHLALRRWNGDGAVRLLRADPHERVVLLERLGAESLAGLRDVDACDVVARLYKRLHVPALPQLRSLTEELGRWQTVVADLPRSAPVPHRLVEQASAHARDLAPEANGTLVHGNLHYGNVLAADREPWLAIAPAPLDGEPAYEIAPMLWQRSDEASTNVRFFMQQRFYTLVDAAGLDEDRARAWVIVRIVRRALNADAAELTKLIALAKAVQD